MYLAWKEIWRERIVISQDGENFRIGEKLFEEFDKRFFDGVNVTPVWVFPVWTRVAGPEYKIWEQFKKYFGLIKLTIGANVMNIRISV